MAIEDPFGNLHGTDIWREKAGINDLRVGSLKTGSGLPLAGPLAEGYNFSDDAFNSLEPYTIVQDGAGVAVGVANGSSLLIATGATDNDEAYVVTDNKIISVVDGKKFGFEFRVRCAEDTAGSTNQMFGIREDGAANSLVDDGAGPATGKDQIAIFKVDGGTVWQLVVGNGASQQIDTDIGAFVDDTYQRLSVIVEPGNATTGVVKAYVDGVFGGSLVVTYTSFLQCAVFMGAKAGTANAESIYVDYYMLTGER